MNIDKTTVTRTSVYALISAMIFVTGITIIADLVVPIKTWLASTYGHHWVGKGIWMLLLFTIFTVVSYPLFKRNVCDLSPRSVRLAGHFAILASIMITLFFVWEYLKH
jgi:hypothetical protein